MKDNTKMAVASDKPPHQMSEKSQKEYKPPVDRTQQIQQLAEKTAGRSSPPPNLKERPQNTKEKRQATPDKPPHNKSDQGRQNTAEDRTQQLQRLAEQPAGRSREHRHRGQHHRPQPPEALRLPGHGHSTEPPHRREPQFDPTEFNGDVYPMSDRRR
jgi:hypothetical protein